MLIFISTKKENHFFDKIFFIYDISSKNNNLTLLKIKIMILPKRLFKRTWQYIFLKKHTGHLENIWVTLIPYCPHIYFWITHFSNKMRSTKAYHITNKSDLGKNQTRTESSDLKQFTWPRLHDFAKTWKYW